MATLGWQCSGRSDLPTSSSLDFLLFLKDFLCICISQSFTTELNRSSNPVALNILCTCVTGAVCREKNQQCGFHQKLKSFCFSYCLEEMDCLCAFHGCWRSRANSCSLPTKSVGVLETAEPLCCHCVCVCDWGHSSECECFLQWAFIVLQPGVLQCSYRGSQPQRVERELLSSEVECCATELTMLNSWPNCRVFFVGGLFCFCPVLVWHSRCSLTQCA